MTDLRRTDETSSGSPGGGTPTRPETESQETNQADRAWVSTAADQGPLEPEELSRYREHWDAVQARFVDHPEEAVKEADQMVGKLIERLSDVFGGQRASLEARWQGGTEADTEDLRVTMQKYRSFMDRLLAA